MHECLIKTIITKFLRPGFEPRTPPSHGSALIIEKPSISEDW